MKSVNKVNLTLLPFLSTFVLMAVSSGESKCFFTGEGGCAVCSWNWVKKREKSRWELFVYCRERGVDNVHLLFCFWGSFVFYSCFR